MKYLLLPFSMLLVGCEAFSAALSDPAVAEPIIKVIEKVPEAAATGEWSTTTVAGSSALSALLVSAATKWLHGRLKNSQRGEVIGGGTPDL